MAEARGFPGRNLVNIASLRSASFFGGPEHQILGIGRCFVRSGSYAVLLFSESGRCEPFLQKLRQNGLDGSVVMQCKPPFRAMVREVADQLRDLSSDVLLCHGYKADIVGLAAARRVGIPVVAVAHGWTSENLKVRAYEFLDKTAMRFMDRVVAVSEGQALKVHRAGIPARKIAVIRNGIMLDNFSKADPAYGDLLRRLFPSPPALIVGAVGRLSPEKGYSVLIAAAAIVARTCPDVGFVLFGDGRLRKELALQIEALGLEGRFVLAGFRPDVTKFYAHMDLFVLPSFTEGLPNVVLESYAAGVPVVATAVGGTPEAVSDGVDGHLVPPGDPSSLARRVLDVLQMGEARKELGRRGQERIRAEFTFESQAERYQELFGELCGSPESLKALRKEASKCL